MVQRADVPAQQRKIDESAAVASQAAVAAADLDSWRVTRGLRAVAGRLEPHRANADIGAFLAMVWHIATQGVQAPWPPIRSSKISQPPYDTKAAQCVSHPQVS